MTKRVVLDRGELLLEKLLTYRGKRWKDAFDAAKVKGSFEMSRVLERYVQTRRRQVLAAGVSIAAEPHQGTSLLLDGVTVRRMAKATPEDPLNKQRLTFIENLIGTLWNSYVQLDRPRGSQAQLRTPAEFTERVRPSVRQQVDSFWPELDFRREYRRLVSDSKALAAASEGKWGANESNRILASLPSGPTVFRQEDLGALCYLDHLLNEHTTGEFDHVVLDEAQEVSALELLVIRLHAKDNGFTILGDLTQSLAPQGIDRWNDILKLFRGSTTSRFVSRNTFRATSEITRFANRVLKQADSRAVTAIPLDRHGPPPSFHPATRQLEMLEAVVADVHALQQQGAVTIAVLSKSSNSAKRLAQELQNRGIKAATLLESEESQEGEVLVAPIHLTRGLEFDAVIVVGASKDNYPASPIHTKLLYLAVSRAAHHLSIHWVGQLAPQLASRTAFNTQRYGQDKRQRR